MSAESFSLLRNMPVFGGLSNDTLELILEQCGHVQIAQGDYFFQQGDAAKSLFVLKKGVVVVEKKWKGDFIELGRFERGDCIGEMSLIDMQPRSASVRAAEICLAMEITLSSLHRLYRRDVEQYAMIMMNMGREVSRRLRKADERLFELEQRLPELCS